jgi:Ca2+/H+ antiporter
MRSRRLVLYAFAIIIPVIYSGAPWTAGREALFLGIMALIGAALFFSVRRAVARRAQASGALNSRGHR